MSVSSMINCFFCKKGIKLSKTEKISLDGFPSVYCQDFSPSKEDIIISQQRIQEKLKAKPDFYTFCGGKVSLLKNGDLFFE